MEQGIYPPRRRELPEARQKRLLEEIGLYHLFIKSPKTIVDCDIGSVGKTDHKKTDDLLEHRICQLD